MNAQIQFNRILKKAISYIKVIQERIESIILDCCIHLIITKIIIKKRFKPNGICYAYKRTFDKVMVKYDATKILFDKKKSIHLRNKL